MKKHHIIITRELYLDDTLNAKDLFNLKVISDGRVIGKVNQIRINSDKMKIEGVVVTRGMFVKPLYIGASYIKSISPESMFLNVYPSVLLKGRDVINSEGKSLGTVKKIVRRSHSNEVKEIIVTSFLRKDFAIPRSYVKLFGESVILKSNYNAQKKYIWQKD